MQPHIEHFITIQMRNCRSNRISYIRYAYAYPLHARHMESIFFASYPAMRKFSPTLALLLFFKNILFAMNARKQLTPKHFTMMQRSLLCIETCDQALKRGTCSKAAITPLPWRRKSTKSIRRCKEWTRELCNRTPPHMRYNMKLGHALLWVASPKLSMSIRVRRGQVLAT